MLEASLEEHAKNSCFSPWTVKSAYSCSCYKPFCLGQNLHFFNGFPTEQLCLWREHLYTGNMRHTGCFMILQPWQKAFMRVLASNSNAEWAAPWKSTTWERTQCKSSPPLKQEDLPCIPVQLVKKCFHLHVELKIAASRSVYRVK